MGTLCYDKERMDTEVVVFSKHATQQLAERHITRHQVLNVLRKPDAVLRQINNRHRAIKLIRRKAKPYVLVVVYEIEQEHTYIVTQFITSKIAKYL